MNLTRLLLTQLLPLLVFIVVDSFVTDVRISILCAVVFAIGQLAVTFARTRRVDWFVLLDVALIAGLGGVSIAFDDELFFKVKPAVVEGATVIFLGALLLAPSRFLVGYFSRMMPGKTLDPGAVGAMKSTLVLLCAYTVVHAGAVLYTAYRASRATWAFVSGPGFYVFFVPVLAIVFVRARRQRRTSAPIKQPAAAAR